MSIEDELNAFRELPAEEVLDLLVAKVRMARKATRESQEVFAARAGLTLRTYKRFEAGDSASLLTFLQVLRALGRSGYLVQLFPGRTATAKPALVRRFINGPPPAEDLLTIARESALVVERRRGEERRRDEASDPEFDG